MMDHNQHIRSKDRFLGPNLGFLGSILELDDWEPFLKSLPIDAIKYEVPKTKGLAFSIKTYAMNFFGKSK